MNEEGMAPDYLREKDWSLFDLAEITSEDWESIERPIARFFLTHTRAELFQEALRRGIMLFPVYKFEDLLQDTQLKTREFWASVKYPELGNLVYPGAFAKCSETNIEIRRPAPTVGEHNLEIYQGELNMPEEHLLRLRQKGVI
jgi:crotonobetainyl-CoA:carnitine CoA-transferase CaiB-like acyl-CoA transferase